MKKQGSERRQHQRVIFKDRVFITFRPHFDRIGWITDISKGGVALEYPNLQENAVLSENLSVDIFSSPRKFELTNLPCRLVYDDRANKEQEFIKTIEMRRCGLVFADLSQNQAAQLEEVLSQCKPEKNA